MKVLVVGASGATGKKLVEQLLAKGVSVRAVVRSLETLPSGFADREHLELVVASLLKLTDTQLNDLVSDCDAIASCLGHNLTFKGMFGQPRRLVTDAVRRLCTASRHNQPAKPIKMILMNTTGNRNRDLAEPISFGQHLVVGLIRLLVPPHADNEQAAEYLRTQVGQSDPQIEWAAVRPDGLIEEEQVSDYELHPSPTRSAIFDAGTTSRINVADFMAELIVDEHLWHNWRGQMPVIYQADSPNAAADASIDVGRL